MWHVHNNLLCKRHIHTNQIKKDTYPQSIGIYPYLTTPRQGKESFNSTICSLKRLIFNFIFKNWTYSLYEINILKS